ncbi:MAG: carbohydrate binding domain-containing protein [Planctomycetota bacterium]|jgi:hypothetical protein
MSRTSIYLACLVAAFALCGSVARGQENQIVNGEFDDGLNGWGRYGAAGFTIEVVHGAGLSGSNAAVFDVTDASATTMIGLPQSGLLLEPGVTYPIGFTARAEQDREMVVLIQTNRNNASWFDQLTQRVQLTTQAQAFVLEYTHSGDALGDEAGETVTLYLMLKGSLWPMTGDALNKKVWLDRVYVGAEPPVQERGQAAVPTPEDGALHEATWVSLQWLPGDFAVSHDVYIGDNFDDVNEGLADTFRGNQPATNYVAGFRCRFSGVRLRRRSGSRNNLLLEDRRGQRCRSQQPMEG